MSLPMRVVSALAPSNGTMAIGIGSTTPRVMSMRSSAAAGGVPCRPGQRRRPEAWRARRRGCAGRRAGRASSSCSGHVLRVEDQRHRPPAIVLVRRQFERVAARVQDGTTRALGRGLIKWVILLRPELCDHRRSRRAVGVHFNSNRHDQIAGVLGAGRQVPAPLDLPAHRVDLALRSPAARSCCPVGPALRSACAICALKLPSPASFDFSAAGGAGLAGLLSLLDGWRFRPSTVFITEAKSAAALRLRLFGAASRRLGCRGAVGLTSVGLAGCGGFGVGRLGLRLRPSGFGASGFGASALTSGGLAAARPWAAVQARAWRPPSARVSAVPASARLHRLRLRPWERAWPRASAAAAARAPARADAPAAAARCERQPWAPPAWVRAAWARAARAAPVRPRPSASACGSGCGGSGRAAPASPPAVRAPARLTGGGLGRSANGTSSTTIGSSVTSGRPVRRSG